ncbi:MAG: hypothetical protein WCD35_00200 [Mycobacteriales bacterium]
MTDHRDLVAALRAVPGVSDADVQPDGSGGLGTLRLDLEPGVDEALVASSVGRILREQFNLGVDAERVQIVEDAAFDAPREQPGQDGRTPPPGQLPVQRSAARPAIARMHLVSSGLDVQACVTLSSGERTATGEARGAASQTGVHRAVAAATLRAVEDLVDGQVRFELDHLEVTPMGIERTVVVSLTLLTARGTERLTGAAGVREDVRQAVIRATLDALNRRLEMLLTEV